MKSPGANMLPLLPYVINSVAINASKVVCRPLSRSGIPLFPSRLSSTGSRGGSPERFLTTVLSLRSLSDPLPLGTILFDFHLHLTVFRVENSLCIGGRGCRLD